MMMMEKNFKNYDNVIADMTIRGLNLVINDNNHRRL